jgi:hypothetical protein
VGRRKLATGREVASTIDRRLRRFGNVAIVNDDATKWMPDDATIYMYSPFNAAVMRHFRDASALRGAATA